MADPSPVEASEVTLPWPSNFVGSLGYAFGKELQYLGGVPVTIVRSNFYPEDTELLVVSTFGFPPSGELAGKFNLSYTGKTIDSFTGVSGIRPDAVPTGARLRLVTKGILPPKYSKLPGIVSVP